MDAALLEMHKNQKQDEVPTVEGAANLMNAKRLLERIDILADDYVLTGDNLRRK